jgi:hypothetical protein
MLNKVVCMFMLICISAQSPLVAAVGVHDLHEDNDSSMHAFFHDSGQPHEHDIDNDEKFEVSYSTQAFEHNNSFHDGGTAGILVFITPVNSSPLSDLALDEPRHWWASPFIKYTTPPPKI